MRVAIGGVLGACLVLPVVLHHPPVQAEAVAFRPADAHELKVVEEAQISPDARYVAYSVRDYKPPGGASVRAWVMDLGSRKSWPLGLAGEETSGPRWSPDGRWIAYLVVRGARRGLAVSKADGSNPRFLSTLVDTNHPLPSAGERIAWSPDSKQLAFVSATPGPESPEAQGDPVVITRYLYKPTATEGINRFNDNRRTHVFLVDRAAGRVGQLTDGTHYEHSIAWSPQGDEILFLTNHEPDPDRVFNYDVFAIRVRDKSIRQITQTKSAEYQPKWSPDGKRIAFLGTKRPLTSSETTMEDTHVWVMNADGTDRREVGATIDNRQGEAQWSPDGDGIYTTVEERGSVHVYRLPLDGGSAEGIVMAPGAIGAWWSSGGWSVGRGPAIAYALATPDSPGDLYVQKGEHPAERLTTVNKTLFSQRKISGVDAFTFKSFDGTEIEAFLTKPLAISATSKHPMIVNIHGGPHGQQGPAFDLQAQVYAGLGWATLMVNYRGSTGYGQKLADAIFKDQDGGEAKDVLAGVDAALARYPWIDGERLGIEGVSYGGQLTDWLITQTDRFKAAIPTAGISNLISFNYMAYYHDYLAVEFGAFPHQGDLMDELWRRSALRYVARVKTPTMFMHGENDNDVPIAEAEQYFIALKDVGVETVMVRYPREGHGIRLETKHVVDFMKRSIAWYEAHFRRVPGH